MNSNKTIDQSTIVDPHSKSAAHYRYRTRYAPLLFAETSRRLGLDSRSRLLDLCCGTGELAKGLSPYAGYIQAIDGAQGMIDLAEPHPRIDFVRADINQPQITNELASATFHHIFIGRAIAYISIERLRIIAEKSLDPDGAVVVCGSGLNPAVPWVARFRKLRESYAKIRGDFHGLAKLARLGFELSDQVITETPLVCDKAFLINHALSYALTHDSIRKDLDRFVKVLDTMIKPYITSKGLEGSVLSWALIYRRTPNSAAGTSTEILRSKLTLLPV